jgi:hypothetical protein
MARLVEASAGEAEATAAALQRVIDVTASYLDSRSRSELEKLMAALDAA